MSDETLPEKLDRLEREIDQHAIKPRTAVRWSPVTLVAEHRPMTERDVLDVLYGDAIRSRP